MSQAAQNLRDILSLARMLRGLADKHNKDRTYSQFLSTATELEQRAQSLATAAAAQASSGTGDREAVLHAPVNRLV